MPRSEIITTWFNEYSHDVYDFLIYYTGSVDVEDLVQEVFIKAIKGLHTYKSQSTPKTWLISIARNVAIDEARRKKRKRFLQTIKLDEQKQTDTSQNTEKLFYDNEDRKDLYLSIQKLRANYRDVIILRGIKEMTTAEAAKVLNWSEAKVRTTYYRALKALRSKVRRDAK